LPLALERLAQTFQAQLWRMPACSLRPTELGSHPAQALFPLTAHAEHHHCRYQYERSERNSDIKSAHLKAPRRYGLANNVARTVARHCPTR
jgi:hypothetical protein